MYASSGNKHFSTKSCHHQTYQNYEKSRQKLGTFLENKVFWKSKFSKTLKKDFENQNFEMFEEVVPNFGKSYDDMV